MLRIVALKTSHIIWSAGAAPDAIELQRELAEPETVVKLPGHIDDLGIQGWVVVAQGLDAKLLMLSVSSRLRPLVAENRCYIVKPHRLRQVMHPVLNIGTTYRSRALRAQSHHRPTPVSEGVHLLGHEVSLLTDAVGEKASVFENRGLDAAIAVELADGASLALDIAPISLFLGQNIRGAPWRSI